ncbi:general transcription factor 3C polypeptide 2 [Megalops cyprinoides]|uniref:general transcription factor 3C polypeptide 2 n=1 Tax=Megalops cyprinoides TaxID=118141 RepID=UPI0018650B2C|nr:general transcription factor 3C polypeptide 2 [Megalops cyprinoides]
MAATVQAKTCRRNKVLGVTQESEGRKGELSGVKQREGTQKLHEDASEPGKLREGHAGSEKAISLVAKATVETSLADSVQGCAGMDSVTGVENGTDVDNGPDVDSARGSSADQQNHDESSCQRVDSTQPLSDEPSNAASSSSPVRQPRKVGRPRKNPRPKKVLTPSKSTAPSLATSTETNKEQTPAPQKRRKRRTKAEILAAAAAAAAECQLTSTPLSKPQNQLGNAEEQEMTPSGRPKRRAAKAAMEYLHSLVEDMEDTHLSSDKKKGKLDLDHSSGPPQKQARGRGKKRKARDLDSDEASGDEDFVPDHKDDESEEEHTQDDDDDDSVSSLDRELKMLRGDSRGKSTPTAKRKYKGMAANGLVNNVMGPIWCCTTTTKEFREEHHASWVFPEWIPSAKDWQFLSASESEKYLPKQEQSPAFRISREGLKEETTLCKIQRFDSLPVHPERWDTGFFVGGPIWSMDWCPCPGGATSSQFAAIYCHRGMDDQHVMTGTSTEPALLQIWDLGELQYDTCPAAPARLAYAVAMDDGCIWDMKWCPSGAWELPTTSRKVPQMSRLGILAAALSSGNITVYSLPHQDALMAVRKSRTKGGDSQAPLICQVQPVAVLKVGSIQASEPSQAGQCFTLDWMPMKPHNVLAAGFYDGTVNLWNLNTKSLLLRVRSPRGLLTLYPYHCFTAHDHAIRTLAWCKASSHLMVTASDDRKLKFWDLRKTYEPISMQKRYISTEVCWPLYWSGICVAQECSYTPYGQHGIHYIDAGYFGYKPYFMAPRKGTIWSASFSDWLNTSVTADITGDVIMVLLPVMSINPSGIKRTLDRRFPVYRTDMVRFGSDPERDAPGAECNGQDPESQVYSEAVKKHYLHFHDMDMRTFKNAAQRAPVKHMQATETKGIMSLDKMPLESLHKVRINPNLGTQSWLLSAGQSGLVRMHCIRAMNSPFIDKMVRESEAQFSAMFQPEGATSNQNDTMAVQHSTEGTVEVV